MSDPELLNATDAFRQLGRLKVGERDVNGVLDHVADLARRTIPGAAEVSVTLVRGKDAYTAAYTGELALKLDNWQYGQGHGPCLDASASAVTLSLPDMAKEDRWPRWAAAADQSGVHSSLSIGLPVHEEVTGALNVYATEPEAFEHDAIVLGEAFAAYAAVAIANAYVYDVQVSLAQNLQAAMQSRAVIEEAKGIIMGSRRCTADEAFAILSRISQDTNRKLRDVAAALVATTVSDGQA